MNEVCQAKSFFKGNASLFPVSELGSPIKSTV